MKQVPKVLAVCSTIDFVNYTRRATLEAIWKLNKETEFLLYTGLKNKFKKKTIIKGPRFNSFYFWIPEKLRKFNLLVVLEMGIRKKFIHVFSRKFSHVFLTDPNQYYLIPLFKNKHIIYLIRDPNVLQSNSNYFKENQLLKHAKTILATNKGLSTTYIIKYHPEFANKKDVHYWPNTVDMDIWNYVKYKHEEVQNKMPVAGIAGNFNDRTDLDLLNHITGICNNVNFILAGKNLLNQKDNKVFNKIINKNNVTYLGFVPFNELPELVIKWDIGLAIEGYCEYTKYTHHNKIYQYLALGKPFVTLHIHNDYDDIEKMIFLAKSYDAYIKSIYEAIKLSKNEDSKQDCIQIVKANDAKKRAEQFFRVLYLVQ